MAPIYGAKILAVLHIPMKSHHIFGSSLMKGLAAKGHEVTMVSPFKASKENVANYKDIYLDGVTEFGDEMQKMFFDGANENIMSRALKFYNYTNCLTDTALRSNGMQNLLNSNEKFDLVLTICVASEVFVGLGHHFDAPIVGISPTGSFFVNQIMGNVAPYSFVPNLLSTFPDKLSFFQRIINTLIGLVVELQRYLIILPGQRKQYELYFKNAPRFDDAIKNVSLVLINTHVVFESPRPYLPNMIPVGGLQIDEPQELPKDLQMFLDEAKEGVIYFSLGSNLRSMDIPEVKRKAIINTFAKLPYQIIWKFEDKNLTGKPNNLKIGFWFPQSDILAHPNMKLFISHGGQLSTTEAVYRGVPLLGIPFYGDQMANTAGFVSSGFGLQLSFDDLTEEKFTETIQEILNNPKYRETVKKISNTLRDQPMKPLDTAIYWIEHIIRHKGGQHLRCASVDLTFTQYLLLDIVAFVACVSVIVFVGIYFICKKMYRMCRTSN